MQTSNNDLMYLGCCHRGGDHFSVNTQFCKNCNFSSEIKYFFTKLLEIVINTICNKNIQKLRINYLNFNEFSKMTESVSICHTVATYLENCCNLSICHTL